MRGLAAFRHAATQSTAASQAKSCLSPPYRALLLLLLLPAAASAQTNLLPNGDFETNLTGWNAGGVTTSTQEHKTGAASARFVNNQGIDAQLTTVAGRRYKLTGWVKISSEAGTDWGGFRFEVQTSSFTTLASSGYFSRAVNGTGWFKVAVGFTATGNSTRVYVGYFGGPARTTTCLLYTSRCV